MTELGRLLLPPSGSELDLYLQDLLTPAEQRQLEIRLELYPESKDRLQQLKQQRNELISGEYIRAVGEQLDSGSILRTLSMLAGLKQQPTEEAIPSPPQRVTGKKTEVQASAATGIARKARTNAYVLQQRIGSGGLTHTYRARVLDPLLKSEFGSEMVAVKLPKGARERGEFLKEIDIIQNIKYCVEGKAGNLVSYFGFDLYHDQLLLVTEYIAGGNLRQFLHVHGQQGGVSVNEAVTLMAGILQGLEEIHDIQIFHRNLTPENVLLDHRIAKISDYGLARAQSSMRRVESATSAHLYMAPETFAEDSCRSSDIWSAGVILYEMLSGRLPFGDVGGEIQPTIDQICTDQHMPACSINTAIPEELSQIVDRSLSKQPYERYPSAREMRNALCAFSQSTESYAFNQASQRIIGLIFRNESAERIEQEQLALVEQYYTFPGAFVQLGDFYNSNCRFVEACGVFERGLAEHPSNAKMHLGMAAALFHLREYSKAEVHLSHAKEVGLEVSDQRVAEALLYAIEQMQEA